MSQRSTTDSSGAIYSHDLTRCVLTRGQVRMHANLALPRIWHFTLGMALYTLYTFTLHLDIKQHCKQETVPVHCGTAGNRGHDRTAD